MNNIAYRLIEKMITQDQMDYELFQLDGKNYCPVDGDITLKEFVDNDNKINFYSLVKDIEIQNIYIKQAGKKIALEFTIYFQKPDSTYPGPAMELIWFIKLNEQGKISVIDSYWDVEKYRQELEEKYPDYLKVFFR